MVYVKNKPEKTYSSDWRDKKHRNKAGLYLSPKD